MQERFLMQVALRNKCLTSFKLNTALTVTRNVTVSAQTVRRRSNEREMDSKKTGIAELFPYG